MNQEETIFIEIQDAKFIGRIEETARILKIIDSFKDWNFNCPIRKELLRRINDKENCNLC